ncbi:hypothetical protein [Rhodanobacter lindaniclasticus]
MKYSLFALAAVVAFSVAPGMARSQSVGSFTVPGPAALPGTPSSAADRSAESRDPSRRIEGLWDEQVEQVDCRSGAPLHPIGRGTNLFMRGGALVATNNAPPTVMGVTLGQWRYEGHGRRFHASMRLNLFQPPLETFLGTRAIERDITLSDHGNALSGVVMVQDYFPDGSSKGFPFCASEVGTRVSFP